MNKDQPRQAHKSWTKEELKLLKKMWESGANVSAITKILKVSKNSVIGKATRMNFQRKRSSAVSTPAPEKKKRKRPVGNPFHRGMKPNPNPHAPLYKPQEFNPLPGAKPVTLDKLNEHQCRFPFGHKPDMMFCGHPTEGKVYCPDHCEIAFVPRTSVKDPLATIKEDADVELI